MIKCNTFLSDCSKGPQPGGLGPAAEAEARPLFSFGVKPEDP